ncbi:MAG TPA: hypothetical protein VKB77_14965 [Terriglobales bacterium]|nr:hypothetical protein [Terriglobales bacterium]
MKAGAVFILGTALVSLTLRLRAEERFTPTVVFSETGFPSSDAPAPPSLRSILPGARLVTADELSAQLKDPATRLLVFPYGSAFPEQAWADIYAYLRKGGNLLVLGGRPFTRSAYHAEGGWQVRDYSVRFVRPLMIDQYETTPGSEGLEFQTNPEVPETLPRFRWRSAFSPVIRLSAVDLYKRAGTAGSLDARLDTLAWGARDGRKLAAPAIEVDHVRNGFDGGRWIFLNAELAPDFYRDRRTPELIQALAARALEGAMEFTARPVVPLYLPGEPVEVELGWYAASPSAVPLTARITTFSESGPDDRSVTNARIPATNPVILPPSTVKGLHMIEAELMEGDRIRATYRSAFWIRDEEYLRSGPRLSVDKDYFEVDGQPIAVAGTTYMSSEVQRLYFEHPNVYVWNRDLAEIHGAGLNMIRTGWWTGWDKFCDENGQPYEKTLRTLEAYLMTARRNRLPVQFNFFTFLPDVLRGTNPYLDPDAVRRQQTLIAAIAARFHDIPWLVWDFINEPSISQHLWTMRPNGDRFELEAWNDWLNRHYSDRAALRAVWNLPESAASGTVSLPEDVEFTPRSMYAGPNSLRVYDYYLFAQDVFSAWLKAMVDAVRASGSEQLITVGQDEGGIQVRLSPAFWGQLVSFTTNHSWWQIDHGLWNSLLAKQPGEALLIQETGLQRELTLDEVARRTPANEAALLERKIACSLIQGAGAIEWLWNTNSYMTESNETPIGAVRPDGTEKPHSTVLRNYAAFAGKLGSHLRDPQLPPIAIVTSQAAQFSVLQDLQLEAQRKAVRALAYDAHLTAYAVAENQIDKLGTPKLAILPSAQALTDHAWNTLLSYVKAGGALLVTGPVERDEHWHRRLRASEVKLQAEAEPLTYHNAAVRLKDRSIPLSFNQQTQSWLESLRFSDGSTLKEVPYGNGRIFWAAYPVELAEGTQPAADLYSDVAARAGIAPGYELLSPPLPGVLIYPTALEDSVLYVMISDSVADARIELRDKLTGTRLSLTLASQHAAMAVLGRREKNVIAKYGF